MSDVFKEQLVKRNQTSKDTIKKYLMIFSASAVSILSCFIEGIGFKGGCLVAFGLAFLVFWLINRMNREYEYIYTNGLLDIDCIYNKSTRKSKISVDVEQFEIIAHINDTEHLAKYAEVPVYDFSSGDILGNTYVFVCEYRGRQSKIIFEPNNDILNSIRLAIPRKFFAKKTIGG